MTQTVKVSLPVDLSAVVEKPPELSVCYVVYKQIMNIAETSVWKTFVHWQRFLYAPPGFKILKFYMVLAMRWVFCKDLRTDGDFGFVHHCVFGFYNRGRKCLLRGKVWFLIYSRFRFVFKRLKYLFDLLKPKTYIMYHQV